MSLKSFLILLILPFLYAHSQNVTIYREYAPRITHNIKQALDLLMLGLGGYQYTPFHGYHKYTQIDIIQPFPDALFLKEKANVIYKSEHEVIVEYPKDAFCIDFSAYSVHSLFMLTVSSFIEFRMCAAAEISLDFIRNGNNVLHSKINPKYTISNLKVKNGIAQFLGAEKALQDLLSADSWAQYINKAVQNCWESMCAKYLEQIYQNFTSTISYDYGRFTHFIPFNNAKTNSDSLQISYGELGSENIAYGMKNEENLATEFMFSADYFAQLYTKASNLQWSLNITNETLPANVIVRLDTLSFIQVMPDLYMVEGFKPLSAKIVPVKSGCMAEIMRNEIKVNNTEFQIFLNDWNGQELLNATFKVTAFYNAKIKGNTKVVRMVPILQKVHVEVHDVKKGRYSTIIKDGLANIIKEIVECYYTKVFGDKTLGEGIALTDFNEKPDMEKSHIIFENSFVIAKVFYKP